MYRYGSTISIFLTLFILLFSIPLSAGAAEHPEVVINGETLETGAPVSINNGRTLVPMRAIFNALGAEVDWDENNRTVTAERSGTEVKFTIGESTAYKNGTGITLDTPAKLQSGHTLVPLRFVSETLGAEVDWDGQSVIINDGSNNSAVATGISIEEKSMQVGQSRTKVTVARIPPNAGLATTVALGDKKVGGVEELSSMASRHNAVLAVNGTFFNPQDYVDNNKNNLPTEPYGTIIRNGKLLHVGSQGATVGFDGLDMNIEQLSLKIEGGSEGSYGWPHNWFAYGVNHTPSGPENNAVFIYTNERGQTVGYDYGTKVVVDSNNQITRIIEGKDAAIPEGGYVVMLEGQDGEQLRDRFEEGTEVEYRVKYTNGNKGEINWKWTDAAVGAGPQLIDGGQLLRDYRKQGFTEDKILTDKGRRTAIGKKDDGTIVIAVADSSTVFQMAKVMQNLGTVEAMNLDGGASSGLWVEGKTIVSPGRKLSNALLFIPE